jgi:hypothetical protein
MMSMGSFQSHKKLTINTMWVSIWVEMIYSIGPVLRAFYKHLRLNNSPLIFSNASCVLCGVAQWTVTGRGTPDDKLVSVPALLGDNIHNDRQLRNRRGSYC